MRPKHIPLTIAACACLALAGCGGHDYGPTGTITGRLTYKDKPLREGTTVSFMQPEAGFIAFGPTDADGNFKVTSWNEGAMPVGTYKVMVQPPEGPGSTGNEPTPEEMLAGAGKVEKADFPAKYRTVSTSDLSFEVKEGPNHFDVVLKD